MCYCCCLLARLHAWHGSRRDQTHDPFHGSMHASIYLSYMYMTHPLLRSWTKHGLRSCSSTHSSKQTGQDLQDKLLISLSTLEIELPPEDRPLQIIKEPKQQKSNKAKGGGRAEVCRFDLRARHIVIFHFRAAQVFSTPGARGIALSGLHIVLNGINGREGGGGLTRASFPFRSCFPFCSSPRLGAWGNDADIRSSKIWSSSY